jgi:anti-sigma B factor antagonist
MSSPSHPPRRAASPAADLPAAHLPASGVPPPPGGPAATASVTGYDGSVIATVSRHAGPGGPDDPGPEAIVTVRGDLDLDTAPLAEAILLQALDAAQRVCLDLDEVRFFGAAGVRVIIKARLHAAALGRALRLRGVHGITERVLVLTGLYPPR